MKKDLQSIKKESLRDMQKKDLQKPKWVFSLLNSHQQEKLCMYVQQLLHFNKTVNLFSRKQSEDFCWEMVLDSLIAGKLFLEELTGAEIADIGSGNGLPGIVWALLQPSSSFLLFEPNKKKAQFLEYCAWKMNLQNVQVKNMLIEEYSGKLKYGVSKAFLSLEKRLVLTEPVFMSGASYYHFCFQEWQKQWQSLPVELQNKWQPVAQNYSYLSFLSERILLKTVKK